MSGETTARNERAANRRRRRGGEGSAAIAEAEASPHLQDALKAAASAAAVGAAVGAARAYSSRRHEPEADAEQTDDAQPQGLQEADVQATEPEQDAEPAATDATAEPERAQDAAGDGEPQEGARREEASSSRDHSARDGSAAPPASATQDDLRRMVAGARGLLHDLDGKDAESVSSVSQTTGGWKVALEVVEVNRIPDSMDVLATYEVELDPEGGVRRIDRVRRYRRSDAGRGA